MTRLAWVLRECLAMMNVETIKARAMSASTLGMSVADCEAELVSLRVIISAHDTRMTAAHAAFDSACDFCLPKSGWTYSVWVESFWMYPAVDAAYRALRALQDDDLAYWARARATDLENRIGRGWSAQATLGLI